MEGHKREMRQDESRTEGKGERRRRLRVKIKGDNARGDERKE